MTASPIRRLSVVPPYEPGHQPAEKRHSIAKVLRSFADVVGSGRGWTPGNEDISYAPITGVLLVAVCANGEPASFCFGDVEGDRGLDGWRQLGTRVSNRKVYSSTAGTYREALREDWQRDVQNRERWAAKKAAEQAEHERTHPWLCDCGYRCKTASGLSRHQQSRRCHRGTAS